MKKFKPEKALDGRAKNFEKKERADAKAQATEEARVRRIGRGLAKQAVRAANNGHLGEDIPERASRFSGLVINNYPEEAYDIARGLLAHDGLTIERVPVETDRAEVGSRVPDTAGHMNVRILDPESQPTQHVHAR
jgi:hypothetical protein